MKRIKAGVLVLGALAMSGCASWRGGQDVECVGFDGFTKTMELGAIIDEISFDPGLPQPGGKASPATYSYFDLNSVDEIDNLFEPARKGNLEELAAQSSAGENILLLSGGGQWGAYGAGLFLGLACPGELVTDRHNGTLPCHDAAGQIDASSLDFAKLDELGIKTITGVSTGGLQSTLLMIVLDRGREKGVRAAALGQLVKSYLPAAQSDLVDHTGFEWAVFQGSVAGTDPLRRHVAGVYDEKRDLDGDGKLDGEKDRSFMQELYRGVDAAGVDALVGFVDASDGKFKRVSINAMLKKIHEEGADEDTSLARSSQCMQAATLASSAMPVFHQQLRVVDGETAKGDDGGVANTLFDGGVRRSVFTEYVGAKAAEAVNVAPAVYSYGTASAKVFDRQNALLQLETRLETLIGQRETMANALDDGNKAALASQIDIAAAQTQMARNALAEARSEEVSARTRLAELHLRAAVLPEIYVLRNGPTRRDEDKEVDAIDTAEPQAMRAYDLLVNELEVGSIAGLRLKNPLGKIHLSTAEGIATKELVNYKPKCPKRKEMMFDPTFMRCLLLTGVQRAQQTNGPWWELPVGDTVKLQEDTQ